MARSKLTLTFGITSIPCDKETAIERAPSFANLCTGRDTPHDPKPIRAPKTCDDCGTLNGTETLVKGLKQGSQYVIVNPEDLQKAKAEYAGKYDGLTVVAHPASDFLRATTAGKNVYYLKPSAGGDSADQYQAIVRLITEHPDLVFAGLHTPMSVTGLYMLTVRDGVLLMQERTREQAIKPAPSVGGEVDDLMYQMLADMVLPRYTADYSPELYEDRYALALDQMISEGDTVEVNKPESISPVVMSNADLMEKLQALKEAAA